MNLRPSYKQTEVGIIPEDWTVVSVGDLVQDGVIEKPLDGNHGAIHPKGTDFVEDGIPFVMANDVSGGIVDLVNCHFITKAQAESLRKGFSFTGDVLLTHKATIGNTAIVGPLETEYIMLTPQVTYYRVAKPARLSNYFLRHYFDSKPFQSVFESLAGGGTRAYLGIVGQWALPVMCPPIAEQRAIAAMLSDVDVLISSLDRLIAKKRDIKQAATHDLLTGKRRLPGFGGDWKILRFDDVFTKVNAKAHQIQTSEYFSTGALPVVDQGQNLIVGFTDKSDKRFACPDSGVIVFGDHTCIVKFIDFDFVVGADGTQVLVTKLGQSTRFRAFDLQFSPIPTTGYNRHFKFLKERTFVSPSASEQNAIAATLADIDAEIAALVGRRDKSRAVKQGMMQQLLTGKIRLI